MITAYYLAQLLPIYRMAKRLNENTNSLHKDNNLTREKAKFLLVLGSSNSDEALRGFFTKYDAASADVNPIGSLSKTHLRIFLKWCGKKWKNFEETIKKILDTVASPELKSTDSTESTLTLQDDEIDIGMTYDQLFLLGKLRKEEMLGPISMFKRLCPIWYGKQIVMINSKKKENKNVNYIDIANIVKTFFGWYFFNRNKMTIVPASVHGTGYSPDDNRHDLRPVFYPNFWNSETQKILLNMAEKMDADADAGAAGAGAAGAGDAEQTNSGGGSHPKYTRRYKEKSNKYTRSRK
jgi:NAD+ synthase (glutamine-hydrolysing)